MPLPILVQQILVALAMQVVAYALTPKPKGPSAPQVGQADFPQTDEGQMVPVVFGTVRIKAPCLLAIADREATAIRKST